MPPPLDGTQDSVKGRAVSLPVNLLWDSLVEKTKQPEKYLPVSNVTWRNHDDPAGSIYREMTLNGPAGASGPVMKEVIVHDEATHTVEFRSVNDPDFIVVNEYVANESGKGGYIEYYVKDSKGKHLGWMKGGREGALGAIEKHYRYAEERT